MAKRVGSLLFAVLPLCAGAVLGSIPGPSVDRLSGDSGLRRTVTAELKGATVEEASAKLGTLLGAPIALYDVLTGFNANYTLDRNRRVSLTWHDVPIGRAVRDFSRAYHCDLRPLRSGQYGLWPNHAPLGPVSPSEDLTFEATSARYQPLSKSLEVRLSICAKSGDAAGVGWIESLRVVSDSGPSSEQRFPDSRFYQMAAQGSYPDERITSASLSWASSPPRQLRRVGGTLRMLRSVRRFEIEATAPAEGEESSVEVNGVRVRISHLRRLLPHPARGPGDSNYTGGFMAHVQLEAPTGSVLEMAGQPPFGECLLDKGTVVFTALLHPEFGYHALSVERPMRLQGDVWCESGEDRKPLRLRFPLIVRSDATRSVPFRIEKVAVEAGDPRAGGPSRLDP